MGNRLVIPKDMRENVVRAIHFGHGGRDAMLREASDIWWPRMHREIVEKAKSCSQCQQAGKILKYLESQNEILKNLGFQQTERRNCSRFCWTIPKRKPKEKIFTSTC